MSVCKLMVYLFHFYLFCLCFEELYADRTRRKIYEEIQGRIFCFRRLNATHQIGCSSDHGGNIGVVHVVKSQEDIAWLIETGPNPPYVAAISIDFFTMATMIELRDSGRVNGVLILHEESSPPPPSFSPDQSCPNQNFGLYTSSADEKYSKYAACKAQTWNKKNPALGMMYEDLKMPVFLISNESSISSITEKCYNRFNNPKNGTRNWLLCAAQLKSIMLAAKDSSTCLRRNKVSASLNRLKFCDPLHDKNVVTTLFPTNKSEEVANRSVIVVGVRLDAYSLFDRLAPGAHTSVTGLVTLLTVANTLSQIEVKEYIEQQFVTNNSKKNVLFAIFNGEAFDYIGSSRIVYDMRKGVFPVEILNDVDSQPAPLSLHHISHFIELSQLAPLANSPYWIHKDPGSLLNPDVNHLVAELIQFLLDETASVQIKVVKNKPLPPASLQSFLRSDDNIAGIVIADHEKEFVNKYYNSMFDKAETLNSSNVALSTNLTHLATAVSRAIYKLLTGNSASFVANETLVKELLECYLKNAACNLFREIADPNKTERLRTDPYPLYVSVESDSNHVNAITQFTRYLLAYLTGEKVENRTRETCIKDGNDQIYQYDWMAGPDVNSTGACYQSTVMFTVALSPAFDLDDWKSTEYSTWTESVWTETSVRIFLQPDKLQEGVTLGVGIFILIVSLITVYFANKHASILFGVRSLVGC